MRDAKGEEPSPIPDALPGARASTTKRLEELDQLRAKGLISDEEYAEKRKRLIDEL